MKQPSLELPGEFCLHTSPGGGSRRLAAPGSSLTWDALVLPGTHGPQQDRKAAFCQQNKRPCLSSSHCVGLKVGGLRRLARAHQVRDRCTEPSGACGSVATLLQKKTPQKRDALDLARMCSVRISLASVCQYFPPENIDCNKRAVLYRALRPERHAHRRFRRSDGNCTDVYWTYRRSDGNCSGNLNAGG